MRLDANDFELLGLPVRHAQDAATLDSRWKALQAQVHPDRFAAEGASTQRVAMQWALRVNEAYQRLKDPLSRAAYLCELHGQPVQADTHTAMPAAFLMQQLSWREALESAETAEAVEALADEMALQRISLFARLAAQIDNEHDWPGAAAQVRALMFITRFAEDIDRRLDALVN
ncbi:Fe-S protein assembly co-chaperone HscB [Ideonella sp. DXS29W]|uniref:Co-chaperone protein HscB homolog n=1 Tax=Ideonella lacteola TaxID=2984193 RepID=A0ABU9BU77_9BURK